MKTLIKKKIHAANIHSSLIYNNQGMEATEAPTDIWMYKEDVIHTHTHTHTQWDIT